MPLDLLTLNHRVPGSSPGAPTKKPTASNAYDGEAKRSEVLSFCVRRMSDTATQTRAAHGSAGKDRPARGLRPVSQALLSMRSATSASLKAETGFNSPRERHWA